MAFKISSFNVTIVSSNVADSTRANAGDVITVTIEATEAIVVPTVLVAQQAADVEGAAGTDFVARYTIDDTEIRSSYSDVDSIGADVLTAIAIDFTDLAGNNGAGQELSRVKLKAFLARQKWGGAKTKTKQQKSEILKQIK